MAIPKRGEIRVAISAESGGRLILVVSVDQARSFARCILLDSEVDVSTDLDLFLSANVSGLPFDMIAQSDLDGPIWFSQLGEPLGHVEERLVEALVDFQHDRFRSEFDGLRGLPMSGPLDPRWLRKERELVDLHSLTNGCLMFLLDQESETKADLDPAKARGAALRSDDNFKGSWSLDSEDVAAATESGNYVPLRRRDLVLAGSPLYQEYSIGQFRVTFKRRGTQMIQVLVEDLSPAGSSDVWVKLNVAVPDQTSDANESIYPIIPLRWSLNRGTSWGAILLDHDAEAILVPRDETSILEILSPDDLGDIPVKVITESMQRAADHWTKTTWIQAGESNHSLRNGKRLSEEPEP